MSDCLECNDCTDVTPPVTVPSPPDCEGEPCEEIYETKCVKYTGPAVPCLNIESGENMESVINKLAFCLNDAFAEAMLDYILNTPTLKSRLCAVVSLCP